MSAPCARKPSGLRGNALSLLGVRGGKSLREPPVTEERHLDVPRALAGLVRHLLLDAGQLLFQVGRLVLVQVRQVVELVFQPLVPLQRGASSEHGVSKVF